MPEIRNEKCAAEQRYEGTRIAEPGGCGGQHPLQCDGEYSDRRAHKSEASPFVMLPETGDTGDKTGQHNG